MIKQLQNILIPKNDFAKLKQCLKNKNNGLTTYEFDSLRYTINFKQCFYGYLFESSVAISCFIAIISPIDLIDNYILTVLAKASIGALFGIIIAKISLHLFSIESSKNKIID